MRASLKLHDHEWPRVRCVRMCVCVSVSDWLIAMNKVICYVAWLKKSSLFFFFDQVEMSNFSKMSANFLEPTLDQLTSKRVLSLLIVISFSGLIAISDHRFYSFNLLSLQMFEWKWMQNKRKKRLCSISEPNRGLCALAWIVRSILLTIYTIGMEFIIKWNAII